MDNKIVCGLAGLLILCAVLMAGCVETPSEEPIIEKKTYVIAIDGAYPPFSYYDADGNPTGFDVESAKWIAEQKGLDITFRKVVWAEIISALETEKADIIYSGMSITPERREVIDFTEPYWKADQSVAVRKDSDITLDQFLAGQVVTGVERDTTANEWLIDNLPNYEEKLADKTLIRYDAFAMSIMGLQSGEVDAVIFDEAGINSYIRDRPLKTIGTIDTGEEYGVAVRKGDTELLKIMNEGLKELQASPKWQELIDEYILHAEA